MNRDIKNLPLELIKLDQENVRFGGDVAESQKEALQLLINDPADAKKLYNLAKDISLYGMDPTELQLVFPDNQGNYIVIEGNRRLAALKLLINPDLHPLENKAKDFVALINKAKYKIPKSLEFSCVQSREDGDKWMELKHTGENNGVGRVAWQSDIRDERKSRSTGVESIGRQLRKIIQSNQDIFSPKTAEQSKNISVTNLTRLFQSTPAQNYFQLEVTSNRLIPKYNLKYIQPSVEYALDIMSDKKFTVNDIRNSEDRSKFIHKIPANLNPINLLQEESKNKSNDEENNKRTKEDTNDDQSRNQEKDNNGDINKNREEKGPTNQENTEKEKDKYQNKTRAQPDRKQRTRIIDWPMSIKPPKINDLFKDLRSRLDVRETPASVAVVFRVFLEVSCDHYINSQHKEGNPVLTADQKKQPVHEIPRINLSLKVQAVSQHLENAKKLSKDTAKAIRKRAAAHDTMGSIDHLNQFVHGYSAMAIPADLNTIADEYKPLLEKIWS